MSELDRALKAATDSPERALEFYRLFLGSEFRVPVKAQDETGDGLKKVARDQRFFPLYVKHEEVKYVPAFDSLDRLDTWRENVLLDYIELSGAELVMVLEPAIRIAINLGTDNAHLFTAEEISQLRTLMDEPDDDEDREAKPSGEKDHLTVSSVQDPPPALEKFIETELPHHDEIVQAHLGNIYSQAHKKKRLTLMLKLEGANSARTLEIQKAIGLSARKILGEHATFFLMIDDGGKISEAIRRHRPIYDRDKLWH